MIQTTESGIVINYTKDGYEAFDAKDVREAEGKRKELISNNKKYHLGEILGEQFLDCTIGKKGLYYDKKTEKFLFHNQNDITIIDSKITINKK